MGKRSRGEACITQLKELNPYVKVNNVDKKGKLGISDLKDFDVIVVTELLHSIDELIEMDNYCRSEGKAIIIS